MAGINNQNGKLYLDFRYEGIRYREYTKLADTKENRRYLGKLLIKIEAELALGVFDYERYFPDSKINKKFYNNHPKSSLSVRKATSFSSFAEIWYNEKCPEWRTSYIKNMRFTLDKHLLPTFGSKSIDEISKADVLSFRSNLTSQPGLKGGLMSASRINHIMTPLRMILYEAADRYDFSSPFKNILPLKIPRTNVEPFNLDEVYKLVNSVRADYRNYYMVRFFTGLRTGEIDGLPWESIDFVKKQIVVKQAIVEGKIVPTKNDSSYRTIIMSTPVFQALKNQQQVSKNNEFVFVNTNGKPLRHNDVTKNIWYPLLKKLGLKKRRPYQTRHTAATLWLAAGESPEWIAQQMGHSTSEMLFRIYSRYVPNLTRQDGSALEKLLRVSIS